MSGKYLIDLPKGPTATKTYESITKRPRTAISVINTVFLLIIGLIVLAANTSVPQITRAPGALMPFGDYATVEAVDGGVVQSIHVRDGDTVDEGQVLLVLTNPQLEREYAALGERLAAVQQRLQDRKTLFEAVQSLDLQNDNVAPISIGNGTSSVEAEFSVFRDSISVLSATAHRQRQSIFILQNAADIGAARSERQSLYVEEQADLLEQGIILRSTYFSQVQRLDDFDAAHAEATLRLAQAQEQLSAIEAERDTTQLALLQQTLSEIEELEQERAELSTSLNAIRRQLDAMTINASHKGSLQTVDSVHVGEVIDAGRPIFEVLPIDEPLIIEARIPSDKIGSVSLDQEVSVTVDAFDVRRVGRIAGDVAWISPVPITEDRSGEVFFRVGVEIESSTIGQGEFNRELQSGMTTVVEFTSEEISLLSTLLGPVNATISKAFTDR